MIDVKAAREVLSEAVNILADPHHANDFDGSWERALLQTINDALLSLKELVQIFDADNGKSP